MSLGVCEGFNCDLLLGLVFWQVKENVYGKKASIVEVKRAIHQIISPYRPCLD